jgi:DNA-binding transcriptional regulator YdaS (Cro superfamily)
MTFLEQIIAQQTSATTVTTISRATETIAEELAQEILKDPEFKAEMKTLIRQAFRHTVARLNEPSTAPTKDE